MKLPRTSNTALLLATSLAEGFGKTQISLAEVSKRHGVSVLFLKKLARALRLAGLVKSKEGSGGGYILTKSPRKISVWEILQAVDAVDKHIYNPVNRVCPINKYCLPQNIQTAIDNTLEKSLSAVTLEDLI